jgi:hypothetical protein
MAFKTNYGQQRAERNRLKQARRQEKLEQKRARASQQKAGGADDAGEAGQSATDETTAPEMPNESDPR